MEPLKVGERIVTGRPVAAADRAFLRVVYGSTRETELARVPWTAEQKKAFLDHQFHAQDSDYRRNYPDAEWSVIVVDGCDAGRLYLHRRERALHILDIALLPVFRAQGIGTAVLQAVQAEACASGKRVSIHVESFNPAKRLYERLGFRQSGPAGEVYLMLEWTPGAA